VTFEQDVASLTGSYSMGVSPFEEQPCGLRGNGTRIKYATKVLRTLLHAKPNISPISSKNTGIKNGVTCYEFNPAFKVR